MDLYITQNSYYFVHRYFIKFFLRENTHIIYVRESKRGLFKKYYEIILNFGFFNTIYCSFFELFYFLVFFKDQSKLSSKVVDDSNLNDILEKRIGTGNYSRVFSIGCPSMINADLQKQFSINIYNLHGGIVPFQKGRFSPIKSLKNGHEYLGASLYLISDTFDDGHVISQNYFKVYNKNIISNYNNVLSISAHLLESFFNGDNKKIPVNVFKSLGKADL